MLSDLPPQTDPRVLIDFRTADDAGVYAWEGGPALVQTVDFFTPIVDDPFTYGQIAAANALSDIYAMGGRPVTALAIAGFPDGVLDSATIRQIFLGGFDKLREAGVALLGGHTVRDPEVKFGYAVTGAVDPARMLTNAGARDWRRPRPHQAARHRHRGHRDQVRSRAGRARAGGDRVDDDAERARGRGAVALRRPTCTRAPTSRASGWLGMRPRWPSRAA